MTTDVENTALTEEEIQHIESMSLEDLLEDLTGIENTLNAPGAEDLTVDDLSPTFESLMSLVDEIRQVGGISRSDAQTLMFMTSSMESHADCFDGLPMNSFTELPSRVNYDVSMENIVVRGAKAIADVIRKIIKWVREHVKAFFSWAAQLFSKNKKINAAAKKIAEEKKDISDKALQSSTEKSLLNDNKAIPTPFVKETVAEVKKEIEKSSEKSILDIDGPIKTLEDLDKYMGVDRGTTKTAVETVVKKKVKEAKAALETQIPDSMHFFEGKGTLIQMVAGGIIGRLKETGDAYNFAVGMQMEYMNLLPHDAPDIGLVEITRDQENIAHVLEGNLSKVLGFLEEKTKVYSLTSRKDAMLVLAQIDRWVKSNHSKITNISNKLESELTHQARAIVVELKHTESLLSAAERSSDAQQLRILKATADFTRARQKAAEFAVNLVALFMKDYGRAIQLIAKYRS